MIKTIEDFCNIYGCNSRTPRFNSPDITTKTIPFFHLISFKSLKAALKISPLIISILMAPRAAHTMTDREICVVQCRTSKAISVVAYHACLNRCMAKLRACQDRCDSEHYEYRGICNPFPIGMNDKTKKQIKDMLRDARRQHALKTMK